MSGPSLCVSSSAVKDLHLSLLSQLSPLSLSLNSHSHSLSPLTLCQTSLMILVELPDSVFPVYLCGALDTVCIVEMKVAL